MFATIPSPSSGSIELGPLTFRAYGLMIAFGVLAAVWLLGRRLVDRGYHADHATGLAMWVVPAGLVGARAYHVITDWRSFEGRWGDAFKIWEGGLGILGGVIAGVIAGMAYARKNDLPVHALIDAAAPAVPLAQAIGRWGNWFNQELFGKPTDLPWALKIDADHRPAAYADSTTFHPTFLYESLWNLALVGVLLRVDRTKRLGPGGLFAGYLAGYSAGRLWIEALRIDTATEVAGLRVNLWVFSLLLLLSLAYLVRSLRQGPGELEPIVDLTDEDGGDAADSDDNESDGADSTEESVDSTGVVVQADIDGEASGDSAAD